MKHALLARLAQTLAIPVIAATFSVGTAVRAQNNLYNPSSLPSSGEVNGVLSERDIPTGQGGFAHDYRVELEEGDQITIDVLSDSFDTIVSLMTPDGLTIAENDDGPDGTTNSLLFARITQSGTYIVRVRAFGAVGSGPFDLKLTRLRPI
ncbi:MAG: PPC domain-containing protein [Cyanobacteria bacterium SID2]|nr:PPC domain-containing protein [Cyanobacteria bacterium SID2]MBP0006549.1 PPC domain-containing protein [Cyanobacteria bacterium SBC]